MFAGRIGPSRGLRVLDRWSRAQCKCTLAIPDKVFKCNGNSWYEMLRITKKSNLTWRDVTLPNLTSIPYPRRGQHTARGPHPARGGYIFSFEIGIFDTNLVRETQIKTKCGPRTKIIAHPCPTLTLPEATFNNTFLSKDLYARWLLLKSYQNCKINFGTEWLLQRSFLVTKFLKNLQGTSNLKNNISGLDNYIL